MVKQQLSTGAGGNPARGAKGDVVCLCQESTLMEIAVRGGDDPEPERPRPVLSDADLATQIGCSSYSSGRLSSGDALIGVEGSPDDRRFLIGRCSPDDLRAGILHIQGWKPQGP